MCYHFLTSRYSLYQQRGWLLAFNEWSWLTNNSESFSATAIMPFRICLEQIYVTTQVLQYQLASKHDWEYEHINTFTVQ